MAKYTSPGDSDRMRILQAEEQKEAQELAAVQQKLASGKLAANDAAIAQMEVIRRSESLRALQREIKQASRDTGVQPTASSSRFSSSATQAPSGSFRVSGNPAAVPPAVAGPAGIGEYIASTLRSQMEAQQNAIQAQQEATTRASQATAATTASTQDRNEQILNKRLRVQSQFGLGPTSKEDLIAQTLQQIQINDAAYKEARASYDQMVGTNFFEDPLGWIGAQLNRGSAAAKVNSLADNEDFLVSGLRRNMTLSEEIERTVQINTNEIDRRTAEFQARQQLAEGEARVAALQAEGARASMAAIATYGAEVRRDQKTDRQQTEDELLRLQKEQMLEIRAAQIRNNENINAITGTQAGAVALERLEPSARDAIQALANGGIAPPTKIVEHAIGLKKSDPALYATAEKLATAVRAKAAEFKTRRANPATSASIGWKVKDDEDQAWEELKAQIEASNAPMSKTTRVSATLTGSDQDKQFNPLRADHLSFVEAVSKAAAAGAPTPVPPTNILYQMFARAASLDGGRRARNPINGQMDTASERAVLGAIRNIAISGEYKLRDGSPVTPEILGALVSEYYKAASSWTAGINKAERMGLPKPTQYNASVPSMTIRGESVQTGVELMNATKVANWLKQEIKANAGFAAEQQRNQRMLDQMIQYPDGNMNPMILGPQF